MGYFGQRGRDFGTIRAGMGFLEDLGADAPSASLADLSVRYYDGAKGWASYQSPVADQLLRGLQRQLRRGGQISLSEDGIIQNADAAAARLFATGNFGGAPARDTVARHLHALAISRYALAARGNEAYVYAKAINDINGLADVGLPPLRSAPPVAEPPAAVQPVEPSPPRGNDLMTTLKSPIGLAAIGVGVALLYFSRTGGRRRRRR